MPADSIIMGIDPGLTATGWGIIHASGRKVRYVNSGKIRSLPSLPMSERLNTIFNALREVAREHAIEYCAVESGYVGRSAQSALKLGQARAAAVLALQQSGAEVFDLSPREVKLAVTGRGSAAKEQVGYMVAKMLGLEFSAGEQDISDALAIALTIAFNQRRIGVRTAVA